MMDRLTIIKNLDAATDLATKLALDRGLPMNISKKSTLVGNLVIEKNRLGLYDILDSNKDVLYENISVFDVAVIIAQRRSKREFSVIEKVIALEEKFSKHHIDMLHYLHCIKIARQKGDVERCSILEDKFNMSELSAKNIRDKLAGFKRIK